MKRHSATAVLRDEHRLILRVVEAFEAMISVPDPAALPFDDIEQAIVFFRLFTDACHHGKEEDLLFAALENQDVPGVDGPVAVMRDEHIHGRTLVGRLAGALTVARDGSVGNGGSDARVAPLRSAGASYIDFIRAHISKEDDGLFEMADQVVQGAACASLCDAYDTVCSRRFEGRSLDDLEALAARLIERQRSLDVSALRTG
ncbi:hemerythrin domain-containing protein [soil metagenome]